jgi:hypothetical protein
MCNFACENARRGAASASYDWGKLSTVDNERRSPRLFDDIRTSSDILENLDIVKIACSWSNLKATRVKF